MMASPIEATLLLCDAAVGEPGGKLHMLGAGWSITGTPTAPAAVAVFLKVPWDRTNERLPLSLFLYDADGRQIGIDGKNIGLEQEFEVGRPPGMDPGTPVDHAFQMSLGSLPLPPGRYQWRLTVAGEEFTAAFQVRAQN
jgi:hypothetical protein